MTNTIVRIDRLSIKQPSQVLRLGMVAEDYVLRNEIRKLQILVGTHNGLDDKRATEELV